MLAEVDIPLIVLFGETSSDKFRLYCEHYNISSKEFNSNNIGDIPIDIIYNKAISVLNNSPKD